MGGCYRPGTVTGTELQLGKKLEQSPCLGGDSGKTNKLTKIYCNVRPVSAMETNKARGRQGGKWQEIMHTQGPHVLGA